MAKVTVEAEGVRDTDGYWRGRFRVTRDGSEVAEGQTDEARNTEDDARRDALMEGCRLGMYP